jgi:hypothetical protein
VKVPERYQKDDIFELAKLYNEKYLPLKDRAQNEEGESLIQLDLTEVSHILPEEKES